MKDFILIELAETQEGRVQWTVTPYPMSTDSKLPCFALLGEHMQTSGAARDAIAAGKRRLEGLSTPDRDATWPTRLSLAMRDSAELASGARTEMRVDVDVLLEM